MSFSNIVGSTATVSASPNQGFHFVRWQTSQPTAGSFDDPYQEVTTFRQRGTGSTHHITAVFENYIPMTTSGNQLRYNTWYEIRGRSRGGLYSRGNNWAAIRGNSNDRGERIRFVNPTNQSSTALINWNAPVRIQRESGGFLGRYWRGGTNWFVFNRNFNNGSNFNLRFHRQYLAPGTANGGRIAISYTEAWEDYDFINFNANGYLYLRRNVAHNFLISESAHNQTVTSAHVDINGQPLRFNQRYYVQLASGPRATFRRYWQWDYVDMYTRQGTPVVFVPRPGDTATNRVINPSERVYIRNVNSNWNNFHYWNPSNTNLGGIHLTDAGRARSFVLNDRRTQQPSTHHTLRNVATGRHVEASSSSRLQISGGRGQWLNSGNAVTNNVNQHLHFIPAR